VGPPEPTSLGEVPWLEPYPDVLLAEIGDRHPGPESRYESREAISLAFVTALQVLPPRQRVVLVLRDVLGFRANETAEILDNTEESVTNALKRNLELATIVGSPLGNPDSALTNWCVESGESLVDLLHGVEQV
jgi:DNA-directed RNA polymerase specialized sigma24 family protein